MLLRFSDRQVWADSVDQAQTAGFVTLFEPAHEIMVLIT